ncbi:hypothetical protein, partial [Halocola ammonii]
KQLLICSVLDFHIFSFFELKVSQGRCFYMDAKANAAISSSANTDSVEDDDLDSFGTCGKPH